MLILNTKTFNFYMTADQLCAQAIHIETVKQTYSGYHCFQLAHLLAHCLHYNHFDRTKNFYCVFSIIPQAKSRV